MLARAKGLRDIARAQPPRGAQRAAAGGDADRHQLRLRPLRRDRGRGDLLLAGPRPGDLRRAARAPTCRCSRACSSSSAPPSSSPTCSPTCSTATSIRGCARHERGRRPLGAPDHLAAPAARAWPARGASTAATRPGMFGLAILALAVAMALAAPLLADSRRPARGQHDRQPGVGQPVEVRPAGHRPPGAQRVHAVRLGRAHQPAGRLGRDRAGHAHRLAGGDRRGLHRRLDRGGPHAPDRVVPRHPVPAAGHRRWPRSSDPRSRTSSSSSGSRRGPRRRA